MTRPVPKVLADFRSAVVEAGADFPRDDFAALLRRMPAYARLAWALARDPRLSRARRLAVLAGAAYVISPVDLVPGIIPLAGQLDDLLVALGVIRLALDGLRPEWRAERLAAAGLAPLDLDADLRTTKAIGVWIGRSGVRVGREFAGQAVEIGSHVGSRVVALGREIRQRMGHGTGRGEAMIPSRFDDPPEGGGAR